MIVVLRSEELLDTDCDFYRSFEYSDSTKVEAAVANAKEDMIDEYVLSEEPELACVVTSDGQVLCEPDIS